MKRTLALIILFLLVQSTHTQNFWKEIITPGSTTTFLPIYKKHTFITKSNRVFLSTRSAPLPAQTIPEQTELDMQCYPNPFRNYTNIHYRLAHTKKVNITIYNTMGQPVKKLINKKQPPGRHAVVWHGSGFGGNRIPPGLYLVRMQTASHVQAQWVRLRN